MANEPQNTRFVACRRIGPSEERRSATPVGHTLGDGYGRLPVLVWRCHPCRASASTSGDSRRGSSPTPHTGAIWRTRDCCSQSAVRLAVISGLGSASGDGEAGSVFCREAFTRRGGSGNRLVSRSRSSLARQRFSIIGRASRIPGILPFSDRANSPRSLGDRVFSTRCTASGIGRDSGNAP